VRFGAPFQAQRVASPSGVLPADRRVLIVVPGCHPRTPRGRTMLRAPDLRRSLLFVAGADAASHAQALQSRSDVLAQDLEDFTPPQSKETARRLSAGLFARRARAESSPPCA
jgi:hypothetical protein